MIGLYDSGCGFVLMIWVVYGCILVFDICVWYPDLFEMCRFAFYEASLSYVCFIVFLPCNARSGNLG